ncbi:MAG: peptidase sortase [Marmoricola sp.]|nr:peptidase sortase [Marmoricola sp.]
MLVPALACTASRAVTAPDVRDGTASRTAPDSPVAVDARPARRAGALRPEAPLSLRLPSGTVLPVRAVSTTVSGVLDVPSDVRQAGWWRGGSRLGDPWGSTLVAAHVDSTAQGLGPFVELLRLGRGERLVLTSATLRQTFRATSRQLVRRGPLLGHPWMSSASGRRRLVLVTCAPPYVPSRGGYQHLAVVTAVPVGSPVRTGSATRPTDAP